MKLRYAACVLAFLCVSGPAHAQFAVIDPANLAQATLIAQRTLQHYEELRRQYETIRRLAQGLGDLERFRTPPLALGEHDAARWQFARPLLDALNSGDPTGAKYNATALPLATPGDALSRLSADARRAFERHYATVEIADSAAQSGANQVGNVRGYYDRLQAAIDSLESAVVNPRGEYHEMTAILDKIAAGEVLARRQDTAINQLLSYAVQQMLAKGKGVRDTEATAVNMQIGTWRDAAGANEAFVAGTGDSLRSWRQP